MSNSYDLEKKSPRVREYEDQIINLVMGRYEASMESHREHLRKCERRYDLYRGYTNGYKTYGRHNIHIPLLFSVVQSAVAHKVQTSLGTWPIVEMEGYGPEDAGKARKNTVLLSAQMKDANTYLKGVDFYTSADIYGTSILQHGWDYRESTHQYREQEINTYTGSVSEYVAKRTTVDFDGPNWEVVDLMDFFPEPGKKRIDEMNWVIRRQWEDFGVIEDGAKSGMYTKTALRKLRATGPSPGSAARYERRSQYFRNYMEQMVRAHDKTYREVEIVEYWGVLPKELVPSDGCPNRVITIANGSVVLRNVPNPFWHKSIPFLHYSPIPDPHAFYGMGKVEIGEKLQAAVNRITNQKMEALDLAIDPIMAYDRNKGIDPRRLRTRAGGLIGVDGPADPSTIRAIMPDLRGLGASEAEIASLWNWIQQSTGQVDDTMMGLSSNSKRQTRAEFLGRQASVGTRTLMETKIAEEAWIEPLANRFRDLNRQYLPAPRELKIIGEYAIINPVTGEQLEPEDRVIQLHDLDHQYDSRARGATQQMGTMEAQGNLVQLLQIIGQNPAAATYVNWVAMLRQTFQTFEFTNADELLNTPQEMQQFNAAAMGVQGAQSPEDLQGTIAGQMMAPEALLGG